jgi:hypothetical protein
MLTGGPGALGGGDLLWARLMRLFGVNSESKRNGDWVSSAGFR